MKTSRRTATSRGDDTAHRILDVAERLVQTRGFNGFSYGDVAVEVAISTASMHYHFATKGELGRELIVRYRGRFCQALQAIEASDGTAVEKLRGYAALYAGVLRADRMCMCGMLAAEFSTLPEPMQAEVRGFFDANEVWLARILAGGQREGTVRAGAPAAMAQMVLGALEGAALIARSYADTPRFDVAVESVLAGLAAA
jgi:TetR/AcrR family transcriptional repressor of nem operon